ncbi:MAG: hypothetical protein ACI90V_008110 [Bacillariaceae sp.]|jgi:hypothetical protein
MIDLQVSFTLFVVNIVPAYSRYKTRIYVVQRMKSPKKTPFTIRCTYLLTSTIFFWRMVVDAQAAAPKTTMDSLLRCQE